MISNGIQDESAPKIVDYYDVTEAAWSSSVTNLPCLIACRRENASGVACLFHKREIAVKHVGEVDMIGRKHPKTLNHLSCQMYILYHYAVWLFKQTVLVWDPVSGPFLFPLPYTKPVNFPGNHRRETNRRSLDKALLERLMLVIIVRMECNLPCLGARAFL